MLRSKAGILASSKRVDVRGLLGSSEFGVETVSSCRVNTGCGLQCSDGA